MISIEQMQTAIMQRIHTYHQQVALATQSVHLDNSLNHILAAAVSAPFAVPRQNVSAMDGYAIAAGSSTDAGQTLNIIGESKAGSPYQGRVQAGQGVRIFTGAVVPSECDTIVIQEEATRVSTSENIDAPADTHQHSYEIRLDEAAEAGKYIRFAGDEIAQDEAVLTAGQRITPTDISLLATLGIAEVTVYCPLTVGILATGDELVAVGQPLTHEAQIYDANTPTLKQLFADLPIVVKDYGIIADDLAQTKATVQQAVESCDILVSTAGVSVGDYDYLTSVIEALGQINHYKVAMKPGKPFVFGELNKNSAVPVLYFGLPGNPLSAVVGAMQFVIPALWRLAGVTQAGMLTPLTLQARLSADTKKAKGRTDFQRAQLVRQADGSFEVTCFSGQQSHRIKQLSQANCLAILDKDSSVLPAGTSVWVQPFPWCFI
ncbi:molybdopterin molybdotransferase MoeA [Psychrobacter aestuarii]|uniref:Molybdopterin molybdenumtransferase n=1 Tax=Psychrobacter aestuarii TaxID=556327 RepID=A0ABP3FIM0_9GAMM|nr:gephyrin-like molybdotransferase Glp [Psychrobacter aestuarii]